MKTHQTKNSAEKTHQTAAAHSVDHTSKNNGVSLEDNRASTIIQQKQIDAINASTPIQKKKNNTGLPDNLKSGMENISGHSLDDVKVHYNSPKPAQLNAHAYAQGQNIHLASGQEKHLPHEAWHVVQQKQGRVQPTKTVAGAKINDNKGLEKEADVMGAKALQRKVKKSNSNEPSNSSRIVQRVEVIQLAVTGAWQTYLVTLANYSADAARTWEPRLEQAEAAGVAPPRLTEHASGSGAGDAGNKAGQMTRALRTWWTENGARIAGGAPAAGAAAAAAGGKRQTSEQKASHDDKEKIRRAAVARRKREKHAAAAGAAAAAPAAAPKEKKKKKKRK
jgi:hypothetical protein